MGLRCGDIARARIEDIDARRRVLGVRGKGGRGELTHWVPIPDEVWNVLGDHVDEMAESAGPLLRSQRDLHRHGLTPQATSPTSSGRGCGRPG